MAFEMMITVVVVSGVCLLGTLLLVARCWRRVEPGTALLLHRPGHEPRVLLEGGAIVLPIVGHAEVVDLSLRPVVIERRGKEGLSCADGIRADVAATFLVRVNATTEDVLRVARSIGSARAADPTTIEQLFTAKFADALKTVARQLEFEQLTRQRDAFRDRVIQVIGTDLNGHVLDDVAIDGLEQTPIAHLDPDNVLDAQGIRKIKSLTQRT